MGRGLRADRPLVPEDTYLNLSEDDQAEALMLNRLGRHMTEHERRHCLRLVQPGFTAYGVLNAVFGRGSERYHDLHSAVMTELPDADAGAVHATASLLSD